MGSRNPQNSILSLCTPDTLVFLALRTMIFRKRGPGPCGSVFLQFL